MTCKPIGSPLKGHMDLISSVVFLPNGRHIISRSDDNTICIWDAAIHEPIGSPLEESIHWVRSVTFSPDGRHIISGSGDPSNHQWPENLKKKTTCLLNYVLSGTDKIPKAINNWGWVCSMDSKLLLWVPDQFRA